jgi:nucleotide-binding universal stress UspA family protein
VSVRRRVLVATDHERCPTTALEHASDLAGPTGEVVLASVLVVPHSQPLTASLDRSVSTACGMLDDAERAASMPAGSFDTRLVRARSFAEGVLETLAAERFDLLLVEKGRRALRNGAAAQIQTLLEKASATVMLVRPGSVG